MKKFLLFLLLIGILVEGGLLVWMDKLAPSGGIGWEETGDASKYYGPNAPDPPYHLSIDDRDFLVQHVSESGILADAQTDFERIAALRRWVHSLCPKIEKNAISNDPSEIVDAFERGEGTACGTLSLLYCSTLIAHGYRARLVQTIRDPHDVPLWSKGSPDTHVTVEVFLPESQEWIVSDPTFNCCYRFPDSDARLNARELQVIATDSKWHITDQGWINVIRTGRVIAETDGPTTPPTAEEYYIDPVLLYGNVFLLYYDIYDRTPRDLTQKIVRLFTTHVLGTEKMVWLLPPGMGRTYISAFYSAANWIPVGIAVVLLMLLIPVPRPSEEEEGNEDEEDEEVT
jgi:hypothetical protein